MIDVEPLIRDELERLAPLEPIGRDWVDALGRAGRRKTETRSSPVRRRFAVALPVAALAVALLAILPGRIAHHRLSVIDGALAAVSGGPVLHGVLKIDASETWVGPGGHPRFTIVNIGTGVRRTVQTRTEFWFDSERQKLHRVTMVGGGLQSDFLETPRLVRDNLRRRDHPGEAPAVEPGLDSALHGYRQALRSGKARVVARTSYRGHSVIWIRFAGAHGTSEEIAVDPSSYRALYMRAVCPQCTAQPPTFRVVTLEGIARANANFSLPARAPVPVGRYANSEVHAIAPREASRLLRAAAVWSGASVDGAELALTQFINSSRHSSLPIRKSNTVGRGYGIRLIYGADVRPNGGWRVPPGRTSVGITQTTDYRYGPGNFFSGHTRFATTIAQAPVPAWPEVAVSSFDTNNWVLQTKRGHLFIEIDATNRKTALAAAKALRTIPG
jgi:hypothetical protein